MSPAPATFPAAARACPRFRWVAMAVFVLSGAIGMAVGLWSCAGIATGLTRGLGGLVACRAVLGTAEGGGIPAAGKAIATYVAPAARALGNALNQAGVSLGSMAALPLAAWLAGAAATEVLRDRRLWAFVAANALAMVCYSLWNNWTTQYLVDVHRLTLTQAARYAPIPAAAALPGGLAGGWGSLRLVNGGVPAMTARFRVCLAAALSLVNAAIPAAGSPGWSAAGISFATMAAVTLLAACAMPWIGRATR